MQLVFVFEEQDRQVLWQARKNDQILRKCVIIVFYADKHD